jgi:hypothetical protein
MEGNTGVDVDVVVCVKCGGKVSAWVMPEHLDYHYAKELQEQEERERSLINTSINNRIDEPPRKKHKPSGKIKSFFTSNNTG